MALLTNKTDFQHSTQPRGSTPDGNFYLDATDPLNPRIQLFSTAEVPTMAGAVPNVLDAADGGTMRALYGAIVLLRKNNESVRHFLKPSVGTFANAGAYRLLNNWLFDTNTDLKLVRGSGLECYGDGGTTLNRVYFGPKSSASIDPTSQPFFQTSLNGAVIDYEFTGVADELIQVFGTTSNGDAGAGDFDTRSYFEISVREWGRRHDRKSLADAQLTEAAGYSGAMGLAESAHPTTGSYTEADVHTAAISPWATMDFLTEAAPVSRTGFNEADGNFAQTIANPAGGSLNEVVAKADAWARDVADIDSGTPTRQGKQYPVLYTFGPGDRIDWAQGIMPLNIPGADLTRMTVTDDAGNQKTFPNLLTVTVVFSESAKADSGAWIEAFLLDDEDTANDYNTATAITYQDKDGVPVVGLVSGAASTSFDINFSIAPPGTTWEAGETHSILIVVGGDVTNTPACVENSQVVVIDGNTKTITVPISNDTELNA